jgi:hypothetical protein
MGVFTLRFGLYHEEQAACGHAHQQAQSQKDPSHCGCERGSAFLIDFVLGSIKR